MTTDFNWGAVKAGSGGYTRTDAAFDPEFQSALQKIGQSLNGAIDKAGGQMSKIITDLNNSPADPGMLAEYQQVYATYTLACNLRSSAVAKAAQLDEEILRRA